MKDIKIAVIDNNGQYNKLNQIMTKFDKSSYTIEVLRGIIGLNVRVRLATCLFEVFKNEMVMIKGKDYKGRDINNGCHFDDIERFIGRFYEFNKYD